MQHRQSEPSRARAAAGVMPASRALHLHPMQGLAVSACPFHRLSSSTPLNQRSKFDFPPSIAANVLLRRNLLGLFPMRCHASAPCTAAAQTPCRPAWPYRSIGKCRAFSDFRPGSKKNCFAASDRDSGALWPASERLPVCCAVSRPISHHFGVCLCTALPTWRLLPPAAKTECRRPATCSRMHEGVWHERFRIHRMQSIRQPLLTKQQNSRFL